MEEVKLTDEWVARIRVRDGAREIIAACEANPSSKEKFLYGRLFDAVQFWAGLYIPPKYDAAYKTERGEG